MSRNGSCVYYEKYIFAYRKVFVNKKIVFGLLNFVVDF